MQVEPSRSYVPTEVHQGRGRSILPPMIDFPRTLRQGLRRGFSLQWRGTLVYDGAHQPIRENSLRGLRSHTVHQQAEAFSFSIPPLTRDRKDHPAWPDERVPSKSHTC